MLLIGVGAFDVVPGAKSVSVSIDPTGEPVPADVLDVITKALTARYAPVEATEKPVQFHKVRVRNDRFDGWSTRVWIDDKPDASITRLSLDFDIEGYVTATVTFLAEVDAETLARVNAVYAEPVRNKPDDLGGALYRIETPAKVESESLESRLKLIAVGAPDVVPGVKWVGIFVDPADAVPADLPTVVFKALAARYTPADQTTEAAQ